MEQNSNFFPKLNKTQSNGLYVYDFDWLTFEFSEEYKKELLRCVQYCRPDMYFQYLFRFIVRYDFEELNKQIINSSHIYSIYQKVALKILQDKCHVVISENEIEVSIEWRIPHQNYSKLVEAYKETILDYINYTRSTFEPMGLEPNDNPYFKHQCIQFFQNAMFVGFLIANSRLQDDISIENYFGAEILSFDLRETLTIYLTPYGMINNSKLISLNTEETILIFNEYVKKIGFERIHNKEKLTALNTSVILQKNDKIYYYKIPDFYECAHDYVIKKIKKPHLSSLKMEAQVSYQILN